MTVDFPITEGPQTIVASVGVEGTEQVPGSALPPLQLKPGQPLNPQLERTDIINLPSFYAEMGSGRGKADAKVDRVAAETQQDAATKQADARKEANADKRAANYKVAIEKCDALAGPSKDSCVSNAKLQYGKS